MKAAKLTKLKSALKKLPSFTNRNSSERQQQQRHPSSAASSSSSKLYPVYVGQSRRRYLVSSEVVNHPMFQVLVDRTLLDGCDDGSSVIAVSCEVVMFDHLLWMLQNSADNSSSQFGSMDELVDFYSY